MNPAQHLSIRLQLGPMTVERLVPPQILEIHFTLRATQVGIWNNVIP